MLGAVVWTYWMHVPLLGAALLGIVLAAIRYYREVALPLYEWKTQAGSPAQLASVRSLEQRQRTGRAAAPERAAA